MQNYYAGNRRKRVIINIKKLNPRKKEELECVDDSNAKVRIVECSAKEFRGLRRRRKD
jgi:hypothetical protein